MADSEPSSVILDTLGLIFSTLRSIHWSWYFSWLGRIIAFPFRLLLLPIIFIGRVLLVVFSPALYVFSYIGACVSATVDFIVSFEPLYTLFGSAAVIGILAGVILGVSSNLITTYLGMNHEPLKELEYAKGEDLDILSIQDESSSNEAEWQWLERSPSRRRRASGLMSQTIHEEEDDDDDSDAAF